MGMNVSRQVDLAENEYLKRFVGRDHVPAYNDDFWNSFLQYHINLLNRIGFGSCFLVQDHVAATFGAGVGYACVVDVGDQKTSVSCVEDGISHPSTRVRLDYGGADVTQAFYWMLQKCAFPYKECNPARPHDAFLLKQLKEEYGHVNLDVCGSLEKSFSVQSPQQQKRRFTLQIGDEAIVAPLAVFMW